MTHTTTEHDILSCKLRESYGWGRKPDGSWVWYGPGQPTEKDYAFRRLVEEHGTAVLVRRPK